MAGRFYPRLRRPVAVVATMVCAAALLTGSYAAATVMRKPLRVLQMNLCGSGIAGCYTGRSMAEAAAVIRANQPDVVTLNEVCRDDVYALDQTLRAVHRGAVASAFKAAPDRPSASDTRCRDGQPYGVGLLVHIPAPSRGYATYGGVYPVQDLGDPEERVWLCMYAIAGFYACTTHLSSDSPTAALAQCDYLLRSAIPSMRARGGYEPAVLGGDLNLRYGGTPDLRSCVPPGYHRADDGAVQQIVATTEFAISSSRSIGMNGTTDHPSLLAALTIPRTLTPADTSSTRPSGSATGITRRRWRRQVRSDGSVPKPS